MVVWGHHRFMELDIHREPTGGSCIDLPLPWLRTFWHGAPTSFGANATVVGTERDTVVSELLVAAEDVVAATVVVGLEEVELAEVGAPADVGIFVREHATITVERANNDIVIRILALFMGANSPL